MTCVLVRLLGCTAHWARDAAEALAANETFQPEVVVLDLGLPDATGYDVARQIRSQNGKQPFIAAMTGRGEADDQDQSIAAGIDMHVIKPASAENLELIIEAARAKLTSTGERV